MQKMSFIRKVTDLFKKTYREWVDDRASRLAAALAYYTIFSLAPLLIIAITVASLFWSRTAIERQAMYQIQQFLGSEGADYIQSIISNVSIGSGGGVVATIIGVVVLILGAIGIFVELRNAMNVIWEVKPEEKKGFWKPIQEKILDDLLAFAMILGLGGLLILSSLLNSILEVLSNALGWLAFSDALIFIISNLATLALTSFIFMLIFKFVPERHIAWRDVTVGGIVTALLFCLGKLAIGYYLANSSVADKFGAAASLVFLLVWVYYSAQILFLGAEFTQVYANTYGTKSASRGGQQPLPGEIQPKEKRYNANQLSEPTHAEE